MGKSQLEKYYAKGWLVYGDKNISSEERLAAGIAFWEEHESCQYGTVRLPDLAQPKVDYTPKMSTPVFYWMPALNLKRRKKTYRGTKTDYRQGLSAK